MAITSKQIEDKLRREGRQPYTESMPPIPVGGDPLHYDVAGNRAAKVNDRFTAIFNESHPNTIVIIDTRTGSRTKLRYKTLLP